MDDVEVLRALAAELYRLPTATDQQAAAAMDAADLILHMAGSAPIEPSERVSAALSALGGWNEAIEAAVKWAESDRELAIDGLTDHVCAHLRGLLKNNVDQSKELGEVMVCGLKFKINYTVPDDVVEFRDSEGRLVGSIVNVMKGPAR